MNATVSSPSSPTVLSLGLTNKWCDKQTALVCTLVVALGVAVIPSATGWLLQIGFAATLLVAAWVDTKTRLIPNRLTYPLVLHVVGFNLFASLLGTNELAGLVGITQSLQGFGLCFAVMLLLFLSNATGGGDVKLAAAIGACMGPQAGLMSVAWCHVLAGGFAIGWTLSQLNYLNILRHSRHYCSPASWRAGFCPALVTSSR